MIVGFYHVRKDVDLFKGNSFVLFFKSNATIFLPAFFLISGVLFYFIYFNRFLDGKLTSKQFLLNRIKRFYPVALLTTLYTFLVCFICSKCANPITDDVGFFRLASSIFLLNPYTISTSLPTGFNVPLWFLTTLFVVHLVTCLIMYIISTRKNPHQWVWLFVIPIVFGIIGYALFREQYSFVFWNEDMPFTFITFFAGIFLGVFLKRFMSFSNKTKNIIRISTLICTALAIYFAIDTLVIEYAPEGWPIPNIDLALYFGVIVFPLIFVTLFDLKWFNKPLNDSVFKYLVTLSVWVFVLNYPIIYTLKAMKAFSYLSSINDWGAFVLIVVINYATAALCDLVTRYLYKKIIAKRLASQ